MPRRRAATLVASILAAAPAWAVAASSTPEGVAAIHLDRDDRSGYTRPTVIDDACLVEALAAQPAAAGFDGKARFTVQRDGTLSGFEFEPAAPPTMAAALESALLACPWVEGLDRRGRPVVVRVTQPLKVTGGSARHPAAGHAGPTDRAEDPGVPPPPVVLGGGSLRLDGEQGEGFRRPALDDPDCLVRALQGQRATAGLDNKVKFAVMRDGSVSHVTTFSPVARDVERAVVAAFSACSWKPALDPRGEPLAVWVVQPLKVAPLPPPPEAQRPLFP